MSDPHVIRALSFALGSALDAVVAEHPGLNTLEVCGVLGAVAGVVVACALPHASAEVDELHLDAMARSYRAALLKMLVVARDAWQAVAH